MKFWIHRTYYYVRTDTLRRTYPILDMFKMCDEEIDEQKTIGAYIDISSVEEPSKISKSIGYPLIVDATREIPEIEIYDDWRE